MTVLRLGDKREWRQWAWSVMRPTRSPNRDFLYLVDTAEDPDRACAVSLGYSPDHLVAVNLEPTVLTLVQGRTAHGELVDVVRKWRGTTLGGVNADFCGGLNGFSKKLLLHLATGTPGRGSWWVINMQRGREVAPHLGAVQEDTGTHRGMMFVHLLALRALLVPTMPYVPEAMVGRYLDRLRPQYAEYRSGVSLMMDSVAFRLAVPSHRSRETHCGRASQEDRENHSGESEPSPMRIPTRKSEPSKRRIPRPKSEPTPRHGGE